MTIRFALNVMTSSKTRLTFFLNVLNMFSFVQKCLNHLGPYYEIRVYYVNLDHDAAALSLILNGLSSGSIVDNNS